MHLPYLQAFAKQLPPSASSLHLLDVGGAAGAVIRAVRPDVEVVVASLQVRVWQYPPMSVDAVALYDHLIDAGLLKTVLEILRPGGRFIAVLPTGIVEEAWGRRLEAAGYVRILVEPAVAGQGVLVRGERPHHTADTHERVNIAAQADEAGLTLDRVPGRFVHLLIRQAPNKPVWRMEADEPLNWQAIALDAEGQPRLLAFTSLPRAVSLMQPAVVAGRIRDVNRVGKFAKETVQAWGLPLIVNPTIEMLADGHIVSLPVDWREAEAPDE